MALLFGGRGRPSLQRRTSAPVRIIPLFSLILGFALSLVTISIYTLFASESDNYTYDILRITEKERLDLLPIPHKLIFSYKNNILETKEPKELYENVQRTIDEYRKAWGEPDAPVHFFTDTDCRQLLIKTAPQLVPYFDSEWQGMYRGDICRVAALFELGGYYFDVDLKVVQPVTLAPTLEFVTCLAPWPWKEDGTPEQTVFFQAFLASRAKHPILKVALRMMEAYYQGKHHLHNYLGPSTLRDAYDQVPPAARGEVKLLQEDNLDTMTDYADAPRQEGQGCCCNFIVHDPRDKIMYFYSRVPLPAYLQSNCQIPNPEGWNELVGNWTDDFDPLNEHMDDIIKDDGMMEEEDKKESAA